MELYEVGKDIASLQHRIRAIEEQLTSGTGPQVLRASVSYNGSQPVIERGLQERVPGTDSITDFKWVSLSETTPSDLRSGDGRLLMTVGYRRLTALGFKNNGVKKAHAAFTAQITTRLVNYYWQAKVTAGATSSPDDITVFSFGSREILQKANQEIELNIGTSLLFWLQSDQDNLYDMIARVSGYTWNMTIWGDANRIPQGDI